MPDRHALLPTEVLPRELNAKEQHIYDLKMENAGNDLEDENERKAIKGIGTPATRAAIIETLFSRGYIAREKRSLVPTEKGLAVYDAVKDMQIANVQMTGTWEKGLLSIEKGELDADIVNQLEYLIRLPNARLRSVVLSYSERLQAKSYQTSKSKNLSLKV